MDPVLFATLVGRMRWAQKRYFKARDPRYLTEARQLERQVDDAVEAILDRQQAELNFQEKRT